LLYTPTISAVVTVAKMLVLLRAAEMQKERIAEIIAKDGYAKDDAEEIALGHFKLV
jgi:hypothetical protein